MRKLNLRQLILLLSVSTALLILANTFYTSHQIQRILLIDQTLEANQAYASKTADSVNHFLNAAQQQLAFAAHEIADIQSDTQRLERIATRLKEQTNSFNSVLISNDEGTALSITHPLQHFLGKKLLNDGAAQALQERRPLISKPYQSVTHRLVVFITHPIFGAQGEYQGFVGGSIYLDEKSVLYALLGRHYHTDQSYIYVVDEEGRLIYHQDPQRVGEVIVGNPAVERVIAKEYGSQQVTNARNVEMLAGYAPVSAADWGVVTQRSLSATLAGMEGKALAVARFSFPFFILILFLVWVVSRWISKPLWQLARSAEDLDSSNATAQISKVSVWYFEAAQLKRAMLRGLEGLNKKLGKLSMETITDPLTGLLNRRGMQVALDEWEKDQLPFSVIMGDIDYFKRINDQFGHAAGDEVLKFVAQQMQGSSRAHDLVCRVGGEEFMILLPSADTQQACKAAERFRKRIESTICSRIGVPITISLGVASWPCGQASIAQVLKHADQALYAAKKGGRNRVSNSSVICD